ncbi:MAG: class IV adenylate cyclase [Planctomycetaceae bacterium]
MPDVFEVEVKYPLGDRFDEIVSRLDAKGAVADKPVVQTDQYFNHPVRDFAETDEALRIRSVGEQNWITWKGPKLDTRTKTRREIELPLGDSSQTAGQLAEVFEILGFQAVATVRKTRHPYVLERDGCRFEIVLDDVEDLGWFLEIEILAHEQQLQVTRQAVLGLASELELGQAESRSYPGMLLNKRPGIVE